MKILYLNKGKAKKQQAEEAKPVSWLEMRDIRASYKELKPRLDAVGISEEQFFRHMTKNTPLP